METTLIGYFQNLLTEPLSDRHEAINKVTRHVPSLVTPEQNATLLRPITIEEVDQALQETPKCKAPRPDGFTSDFFHHCWPMIRTEVWERSFPPVATLLASMLSQHLGNSPPSVMVRCILQQQSRRTPHPLTLHSTPFPSGSPFFSPDPPFQ
jgi:hypothetical protein